MKCPNCGADNRDNSAFCAECGQRLSRGILPPELAEVYRIKNKIEFVNEHSKPMNIYCFVMMGILAVVLLVSLIMKVEFIPVFAIILIGIYLLLLFANNRESKRVRLAIGRPLVVIMAMLVFMMVFLLVFMIKTGNMHDDAFFDTEVSEDIVDEETTSAAGTTSDGSVLSGETGEELSGTVTYECTDGWRLDYDTETFFLNDTLGNGEIYFNYLGECGGTTGVSISCYPGKMPDEVLYDRTSEVEDDRIERGEAVFGKDNYWSHYRYIKPVNEDPQAGDIVYEDLTAIEHNGGTVLVTYTGHYATEEQKAAIEAAVTKLCSTLELTGHEPQTEYSYIPGKYVRRYREEFLGEDTEFENTVLMYEDHSCEVTFQDTVRGQWTGTFILLDNGEKLEFTVEGDNLLLNDRDTWLTFEKE